RSIIATAILRPASLALVLMLRLAKESARSSTITWSITGAILICELLAKFPNLSRTGSAEKAIWSAKCLVEIQELYPLSSVCGAREEAIRSIIAASLLQTTLSGRFHYSVKFLKTRFGRRRCPSRQRVRRSDDRPGSRPTRRLQGQRLLHL